MKTNLAFFFLFFFVVSSMVFATTMGFGTGNQQYGGQQSYEQYSREMDKYFKRWYRYPRAPLTCDRYPKVCSFPGSLGPNCCQRHCVDLKFDPFNCGKCGQWCSFGQICCHGKCVNLLFDKNNCGWCGNRCGEGSFCRYGMCSYA